MTSAASGRVGTRCAITALALTISGCVGIRINPASGVSLLGASPHPPSGDTQSLPAQGGTAAPSGLPTASPIAPSSPTGTPGGTPTPVLSATTWPEPSPTQSPIMTPRPIPPTVPPSPPALRWVRTGALPEGPFLTDLVSRFVCDPTPSSTALIAVQGRNYLWTSTGDLAGPLAVSVDGGSTWSAFRGEDDSEVVSFAIAASNPSTMFRAGTGGDIGGTAKSIDGGQNWTSLSGTGYGLQWAIAVDPADADHVLVATGNTSCTGCSAYDRSLYRSTNGGFSFSTVIDGYNIVSIAFNPASPSAVFAAAYSTADDGPGGMFASIDRGATWTEVLEARRVADVVADPASPSVVYAATEGDGVFKSTDGGSSWTAMNSGLTSKIVRALAIDPADSRILYAGTWQGGVYVSRDGAESWSQMNDGLSSTFILSVAACGEVLLAGTESGGVFKWQ